MTAYVWAESGSVEPDGTDESELLIVPEDVMETWLPLREVLRCSTRGQVTFAGILR